MGSDMTDTLSNRLEMPVATRATRSSRLACESQLRIAAATLRRARHGEITAITAIGVLGADDLQAFNGVVAAIEDEFDLEATVRMHVGSFSVSFRIGSGSA